MMRVAVKNNKIHILSEAACTVYKKALESRGLGCMLYLYILGNLTSLIGFFICTVKLFLTVVLRIK